jgi:hypothetical protein
VSPNGGLDDRNSEPNCTGVWGDLESEGSSRQTPGSRNTNYIGGDDLLGESAKRLEARCHSEQVGVSAADMREEN